MHTQALIDVAKGILSRYNELSPADQFPIEQLEGKLRGIGAMSADDLLFLKPEDLSSLGIPLLQARQICALFRDSKAAQATSLQHMVVRTVRDEAAELSNLQLIMRQLENPTAKYTAVAQQLIIRSRGQAFLVQSADGSFDPYASADVLEGIAQGEEYNGFCRNPDGTRMRLFHLGEYSSQIKDEDPLHPGKALRRDGTSTEGIYWGAVSLPARQFVRLAIQTREINPSNMCLEQKLDLRDRAQKGLSVLQERYPKAMFMFEDQREIGGLPLLKVRNSGNGHLNRNSISASSPTNNEDEYDDDNEWNDQ